MVGGVLHLNGEKQDGGQGELWQVRERTVLRMTPKC